MTLNSRRICCAKLSSVTSNTNAYILLNFDRRFSKSNRTSVTKAQQVRTNVASPGSDIQRTSPRFLPPTYRCNPGLSNHRFNEAVHFVDTAVLGFDRRLDGKIEQVSPRLSKRRQMQPLQDATSGQLVPSFSSHQPKIQTRTFKQGFTLI